MLTGFEDITKELTEYELNNVLPLLIKGFQPKIGVENSITSTEVIKKLKERNISISPPRFRKLVNCIRVCGFIPNLASTSKGYFIASTKEEAVKCLQSLAERISSMEQVYDALEFQYKNTLSSSKREITA